jgi:tetratricopeptide (TPR) repeat protein
MARKKKGPDGEPPGPAPEGKPPEPEGGSKPGPRPKAKPKAKAGAKPKSKAGPKRKAKAPSASSGRRKIETLLRQAMGLVGPGRPADPARERAEDLLQQAYEADDPEEIAAMSRRALEAWPDCADAYVLLAEVARGPKEALDLYARGVEAGSRDLGGDAFRELAGHFWAFPETRPYMRARFGLAQVLWVLGRRDEAVGHYQEMLRLNPNDNQGVRYTLAACLLETGRDKELSELLSAYEEDPTASWAYSAALLAFRREGDSPLARSLLRAAREVNPHVPDLLLGRERLPSRMPETVGLGDRNEAVDYVAGFLRGWRATPGAIAWLRQAVEGRSGRGKAGRARARGPTAASKTRLKKLPIREGSVWQVEARKMPAWVSDGGELRRPWVVLVASRTSDLILGQALLQETPTPGFLWDTLSAAMQAPSAGPPHRPAEIEVRPGGPWDELAGPLDAVGVRVVHADELDLIDRLMDDLAENVFGPKVGPGLLDMPGVTPDQVAGFFQAAAGFYRASPWQRVTGEETIKVACDRYESGPWYAVIIGQMGMTLGLALYEDLDALVRMREGDASDEENARETVALSITYGDETEVPVQDLDAAEQYGWEVAGPEAYPAPMRKERGLVMRPPLAWELRLLEACLRAIPPFVARHDRDDPAPFAQEVPTAAGPLTLELSWVKA